MPIYAYKCTACGAHEEHIQRFSDPPMTSCDSCGGSLEKLLSAAAFHLKGGGWYKDGYASAKPGDSVKPVESKSESKGTEKKSDSGAKAAAE